MNEKYKRKFRMKKYLTKNFEKIRAFHRKIMKKKMLRKCERLPLKNKSWCSCKHDFYENSFSLMDWPSLRISLVQKRFLISIDDDMQNENEIVFHWWMWKIFLVFFVVSCSCLRLPQFIGRRMFTRVQNFRNKQNIVSEKNVNSRLRGHSLETKIQRSQGWSDFLTPVHLKHWVKESQGQEIIEIIGSIVVIWLFSRMKTCDE